MHSGFVLSVCFSWKSWKFQDFYFPSKFCRATRFILRVHRTRDIKCFRKFDFDSEQCSSGCKLCLCVCSLLQRSVYFVCVFIALHTVGNAEQQQYCGYISSSTLLYDSLYLFSISINLLNGPPRGNLVDGWPRAASLDPKDRGATICWMMVFMKNIE